MAMIDRKIIDGKSLGIITLHPNEGFDDLDGAVQLAHSLMGIPFPIAVLHELEYENEPTNDHGFVWWWGKCDVCKTQTGTFNNGKWLFGYCAEHKKCWRLGCNLTDQWKSQTIEEQKKICIDLGVEGVTSASGACMSVGVTPVAVVKSP